LSTAKPVQPMLALEGVVKHFRSGGEEVRAVDGVGLELHGGEMVALQGPSGSGKTTLLLLIAGLIKPDEGSLRYEGTELASRSDDEISEYLLHDIGFIYQTFQLMPRVSALENAAMKLLLGGMGMGEAKERALPWLERVGLGERLEHTPEELSGGERQRVAIARALATEPRMVLADEPTGTLDSARSREIVSLLHEISRERQTGVLLVTHDAEAASAADRQRLMRDGILLEQEPREAATDQRERGADALGAEG
jgi:putative ABC transport system ATP-binding protein